MGRDHVHEKKGGVACPHCETGTRCTDSRPIRGGTVTMRRRECRKCKRRFTTYERAGATHPPDNSILKRVEIALTSVQTAVERLTEMQMILSDFEEEAQRRRKP